MNTPWELFGVECGRGWSWIVTGLLQAALDEGVIPTQVKEKFGGLRFYYYGGSEKFEKLVEFAEALAEKTCEVCGEPGQMMYDGYWQQTLCPEHGRDHSTTQPDF